MAADRYEEYEENEILTPDDLNRLENFYSSRFSKVSVAQSWIRVFTSTQFRQSMASECADIPDPRTCPERWELLATGAAVLLTHLDKHLPTEVTNGTFAVCHLPTCELIWQCPLSERTTYTVIGGGAVHVLRNSEALFALVFREVTAAIGFFPLVVQLIEGIRDYLNRDPREKKHALKAAARKLRKSTIKRDSISTPCLFRHVSTLANFASELAPNRVNNGNF